MADEGSAQNRGIKVIFFMVGGILTEGSNFTLNILLTDLHQEVGEETITAAEGIKSQDRGTPKSA
jgi:hypothetical protein